MPALNSSTNLNHSNPSSPITNGHSSRNGNSDSIHHDHFTTRSIHVGSEPDPSTGAVVPSLSVATTFKQDGVGKDRGHDYSRSSNPTRSNLEALITSLETSPSSSTANDGDRRHDASSGDTLVFASGSAATAAMCSWVSLNVEEGGAGGAGGVYGGRGGGGHVLAVNDVYGGTARYLSRTAKSTGLEVTYLDMQKAGEQGIREAIRPDTRVMSPSLMGWVKADLKQLIWLEVPTNPLLLVPPLPLITSILHSMSPATRPLIIVDSTFLSPFYITPLISSSPRSLPLADLVLSSLSKYSGGHSDIILGSLTVSPATIRLRPDLLKGLRFLQNSMGAAASPRDCHLMIRSLKTLSMRMLRHGLNALRVAAWLCSRPEVDRVRYPGLETDGAFQHVEQFLSPNARKELEFLGWKFPYVPAVTSVEDGCIDHVRKLGIPFGGMITFGLQDATAEETDRFATSLRLIVLAESLGGVESLVEVPYGMTHSGLPEETRAALGITPNLIRLSVGIEDVDDVIADLEQGLRTIKG